MTKQAGRYTIIDLGAMGSVGQPFFVTDNRLVTGGVVTDGSLHAFVWGKGTRTDIGTLGIGNANAWAYGVNEHGQAVGQSEVWATDPYNEDFCGFKALGLPTWGARCLPFIRQNGELAVLPTLGGNNGVASWINAKGDAVGWTENTTIDPNCPAPQKFQFRPVIWQGGAVQELQLVGKDLNGVAIAINDSGQAAGGSGNCSTFSPQLLESLQSLHAVLWQGGKATDLGNLGGTGHYTGNIALGINQLGQVVGNSDLAGDKANHAFLWTKEKGMQDLGTLPGDLISAGISINDRGEVVGVSLDASFNLNAYHWQNGRMQNLNDLVAGETSLYMMLACSINAAGEITGLAFDTNSNELHGYLAIPASAGATQMNRPVVLTDAHRRQIQQQISKWRVGTWLAPPK
jgi:probable HAF family extracellular repeat protein